MTRDDIISTMCTQINQYGVRQNFYGGPRSKREDYTKTQELFWDSIASRPLPRCPDLERSESLSQSQSPGVQSAQYYYRSTPNKNKTTRDLMNTVSYFRMISDERCRELLKQHLPPPSSSNGCVGSHSFNLKGIRSRTPRKPTKDNNALYFAGSKSGDAPPPSFVPPPPQHWIKNRNVEVVFEEPKSFASYLHEQRCLGLTSELKVLLHVQ